MLVMGCGRDENWKSVSKAVEVMRSGGVVVYPTDTVYGMGCDLLNKKALERVYQIKKMPRQKPLSIICADLGQVAEYAQLSNSAFKLLKRALPGPFTFVLQATRLVPKVMLSKQHTVGIRVPDHPICLEIAKNLGNPIVNTSASCDIEEVVSDPEIIEREFHMVDLMLSDGWLESDPSTVVDLTGEFPEIIRDGKGDLSEFMR